MRICYTHRMMRESILAIVFAFLTLFVPAALADVVTLKDGTVYEGTVTSENAAQVVIEIVISNIKTTKTFPRYKVRSVEYKPLPDDASDERDTVPDDESQDTSSPLPSEEELVGEDNDDDSVDRNPLTARERLAARKRRVLYMEIPINGAIGELSNAYGLRNALKQAERKGVQHIVFTIDSPGGFVYDAVEAMEVLKEYDEEFEYHAVIDDEAISAASIYAAASDHIWVRSDSRLGGAVAYSDNTSTGAAEVDAKMNSIWAAEIASRAVEKGHPPEVFRAMVEPAAEVWVDDEGKAYPSRPSTPGAMQLDNSSTVLTIRADQMIEIGMAKLLEGEIDALGELMDIQSWYEVKRIGTRAMETAGEERVKLGEKYTEALEVFRQTFESYEQDHPESFSDYYFVRTQRGEYLPDGPTMIRWRERVDKTVRHCDIMLEALTRMAEVNKRAAIIGALHLEIIEDDLGDKAYTSIQRQRDWLTSNRNRGPEYN